MAKKLLLIILSLPFFGLACSREQWLGTQNRLRRFIEERSNNFVENLSTSDKQAIEGWLLKNKLNEYGDSPDTVYTGGTPLFNEKTGTSTSRYEYLFKKFPELKEIVRSASEK